MMIDAKHPKAAALEFALAPELSVPEAAMGWVATLLIDTIGVAAGATLLASGKIARDHAVMFQNAPDPRHSSRIMFDGRRASLPGAGYAAATQIDNLDGHDGYNPTKGHIGCAVVPALFALGEGLPDLSGRQALTALAMSYEFAARAGITLHATVSDYHTSGAWNALGVAALACRLRGAAPDLLRHALGIAEYHGPRSQMMREIDNPTMLHDGSGMGAWVGLSAALLAERGFTGAPAITVEAPEAAPHWQDLGQVWTVADNYIKPYPVCRWAHAAIDALYMLRRDHTFTPDDVAEIEVRTFSQAARLFAGIPETTSQAQYSLGFALATMLVHGRIGPGHISGRGLKDGDVAQVLPRITVIEDERYNAQFPASRVSEVSVTLSGGRVLSSGATHARGGPESPLSDAELYAKFRAMTDGTLSVARANAIWAMRERLLMPEARFSELSDLVMPAVEGAS